MSFLSKDKSSGIPFSTWRTLALYVVVVLILDIATCYLVQREYKVSRKINVTQELGLLRAQIEEKINTNLFIMYGMAAHLSIHGGIENDQFEALASVLLSQSRELKNIAIAPDFVISNVYPLEENRAVLGLDYRKVKQQWLQARAAFTTGQMSVAGPLELVQGGYGVIARIPVFSHETGKFWGLVSSVMDFNLLLKASGFHVHTRNNRIAIRGKDGKGASGKIFKGDPALFTEQYDAVLMPIALPTGSWQIAAQPLNGWKLDTRYFVAIHVIYLALFAAAALSWMLRRRGRMELIDSENRLKSMSQASHDALIMMDEKGYINFWNPAAESMFGYSTDEAMGKELHTLLSLPADNEKAHAGMPHFTRTGTGPVINTVMEMTAVRKNGEVFPIERSVSPFQHKGKWYAVGSVRDITDRKRAEEKLIAMATTDPLTGMPNRRQFIEEAERQCQLAVRHAEPFSVLMFDLDHFKSINDTYGHDIGDIVLKEASRCLMDCMRNTDICGRVGGEEFAMAFPNTAPEQAFTFAERFRRSIMDMKINTGDDIVTSSVSIGIAGLCDETNNLELLLKRADEALYKSKHGGRNQVSLG
jgi:diguanylate cyclase (GGDEF)-like protein/PAS domain S-box-containing protein